MLGDSENVENCCIAKGVSKIEMMEALSSAYQINKKGILLVDDKETILIEAITHGFQAASPMEVVNYASRIVDKEKINK